MCMNKLRGIMAEKGYTQRKMAADLGMSKNTINAKLSGKTAFDTAEVLKICDLLGITDAQQKVEIFL